VGDSVEVTIGVGVELGVGVGEAVGEIIEIGEGFGVVVDGVGESEVLGLFITGLVSAI
jgi:hypothetical protein